MPRPENEARTVSRRYVLKGGAILGALFGGGLLPGFVRRALAGDALPGARKVLVFLFLRGALDGLDAVAPYGDPRLAALRPTLALPPADGVRKSDAAGALLDFGVPGFGLNPALEPLLPCWREGTLAFVHAVGSPEATRSHFDAQDFLELGTPGIKATRDGWMTRALSQLRGSRGGALDAIAVSQRMPRSLQGEPGALAFATLDQLRLRPIAGAPRGIQGRTLARQTFEALYDIAPEGPVAASGKEAFAAVGLLEAKLAGQKFRPGEGGYPAAPIGRSLQLLATLIKADVGLRVGFVDAQGWDTHLQQRPVLARNLAALAAALAAFRADLGPRFEDVVLVAATEFGRTVRQNGTMGTDHGHGSVALVLGGRVAGGRMHGRWPGLGEDQLYEGRDLAVTTDLRAVLAAAARAQLGARDVRQLFPGYTGPVLDALVPV